jgi:predicted lipid-binding transport protein (Tim44 family)
MVGSMQHAVSKGLQRLSAVGLSVVMAFALLGVAPMAEAKRMGGGGSIGRQAMPPSKPAPAQATPAPTQASPTKAGAAPAGAAAAPARSSWMGPMVGLAAGLGLAALASHLGMGEELMSLMLMVLIGVVAFVVIRMLFFRRPAQPVPAGAGAGMGQAGNTMFRGGFEQSNPAPAGNTAGLGGWGQPAPAEPEVEQPSAAEVAQFLSVAKGQFTSLQKLWDTGDIAQIQGFCTPAMAAELAKQLGDRADAANLTSVVNLEAEWMGLSHTTDDDGHDVEEVLIGFTGLIRESADGAAEPFSEVWTLHKRRDNSTGWLLAGITQQ